MTTSLLKLGKLEFHTIFVYTLYISAREAGALPDDRAVIYLNCYGRVTIKPQGSGTSSRPEDAHTKP